MCVCVSSAHYLPKLTADSNPLKPKEKSRLNPCGVVLVEFKFLSGPLRDGNEIPAAEMGRKWNVLGVEGLTCAGGSEVGDPLSQSLLISNGSPILVLFHSSGYTLPSFSDATTLYTSFNHPLHYRTVRGAQLSQVHNSVLGRV